MELEEHDAPEVAPGNDTAGNGGGNTVIHAGDLRTGMRRADSSGPRAHPFIAQTLCFFQAHFHLFRATVVHYTPGASFLHEAGCELERFGGAFSFHGSDGGQWGFASRQGRGHEPFNDAGDQSDAGDGAVVFEADVPGRPGGVVFFVGSVERFHLPPSRQEDQEAPPQAHDGTGAELVGRRKDLAEHGEVQRDSCYSDV